MAEYCYHPTASNKPLSVLALRLLKHCLTKAMLNASLSPEAFSSQDLASPNRDGMEVQRSPVCPGGIVTR